MIIKKTLQKYLPEESKKELLDPFPSLRHALEWVYALESDLGENAPPAASELYLANALMGATRAVLEHYEKENNLDLSDITGKKLSTELSRESVAENQAGKNESFADLITYMSMEYGSKNQAAAFDRAFSKLPDAFSSSDSILTFLQKPAELYPDSLDKQAEYVLREWQPWLGKWARRLLKGIDYYSEEHKARFQGPGRPQTLDYSGHWTEAGERYSPDQEWMPGVVMVAKNSLVWLDQLSRKYDRDIHRLDQIPEEELDLLASYGFNALWLIGLWERSPASKTIKHWCGNPEAESSAYSVKRYHIADMLGGEEATETLRYRCMTRGIRLASDMVPNHTSIDSDWMMDHPDWFVSRHDAPYPAYSFSGQSLSGNDRVGIYLEDHYFSQSDAAVVFKRVDHHTGDERYIYHGNDGTSMPWNDTAQLNYLHPETREAVIQTILHVARQFPIIRFDAAMTLAKKHFQRLWFPIPGTGSDVASRADFGMTKEEFDSIMGEEFWREVVDRVAVEVPDTLLLAEAFWLMEGYFVRTLGMHRVYNSAFMNMLKMEENDQYRLSIKRTLEFDPEILKRFVNFMNNPDEEPAIIQFGNGDKYFGVATLLVTMPGLPMWGHGQTEGFHEKYGMEYVKSYWDEHPDMDLIERHKHEIFPLIKKRYLFAESSHFRMYDFHSEHGEVNENVFAYSNRHGNEKALILVNNSYESTTGSLRFSVPYKEKSTGELSVQSIADALQLDQRRDDFLVLKECKSDLEYIHRISDLMDHGFGTHLQGYGTQVFLEFDIWTASSDLETLYHESNGHGVPGVSRELALIPFRMVHHSFSALIESLTGFKEKQISSDLDNVIQLLKTHDQLTISIPAVKHVREKLLQFNSEMKTRARNKTLPTWYHASTETLSHLTGLVQSLGETVWKEWEEEALLDMYIQTRMHVHSPSIMLLGELRTSGLAIQDWIYKKLNDRDFCQFIGCNEWEGAIYIDQESFEKFLSNAYAMGITHLDQIHELLLSAKFNLHEFSLLLESLHEEKKD